MGKILKYLLFFALFVCASQSMMAQNKQKNKNKEEEVEKPPPPIEELKEVRIDTSSSSRDISEPAGNNKFIFNDIDTIPPPDDELTAGIRKMMKITGALNLGVEIAKSLQNSDENDILPTEFYDRMFMELTKGESRILFENLLIKVYRKHFTLEDINVLTYFYESETGKKMLSALPKIMEESQKIGAEFGRTLGLKIYQELIKEGKIN